MRKYLLLLLLAGSSCARGAWHAPLALPPADSALVQAFPTASKIKVRGNVYLQRGQTNTLVDNTNAGRKGNAATAPGAVATAVRPVGPPWWVYALLGGLGLAGGFVLRGRLRTVLPW